MGPIILLLVDLRNRAQSCDFQAVPEPGGPQWEMIGSHIPTLDK